MNRPMKDRIMVTIFVSGCFDILHAGHIQFFKDAAALGYDLTVCFCSAKNLLKYKGRVASMPDDNKQMVLESIRYINHVIKGSDDGGIWDFVPAFLSMKPQKPDVLAVTSDDKHQKEKRAFCKKHRVKFVVLPKRNLVTRVSTSEIREGVRARK